MTQYIDKDVLVAEINKRIIDAPVNNIGHQRVWAYNDVKDILDTIEVKEVKKESVSEDLEKALAREWHGYNDRGAATVDALEDNTQELAFAKGFYRGAKWQKKQMMANAVEGVVHHFEKCKVDRKSVV